MRNSQENVKQNVKKFKQFKVNKRAFLSILKKV